MSLGAVRYLEANAVACLASSDRRVRSHGTRLKGRSTDDPDTEVVTTYADIRAPYSRLYEAARRTALVLNAQGLVGLVDGDRWQDCGPDFVFCYATEMRRLDEVGKTQEPDDPGDFPTPPSAS
jgi:hypothetical protein